MNADEASVALGISGFALGVGFAAHKHIAELEERCAFLADMKQDMTEALRDADTVLADERTPVAVREMLVTLLVGHASEEAGKRLAAAMFSPRATANDPLPEDNQVSVGMRELADAAPTLERAAHRAAMSLILGLLVSHRSDNLQVSRVRTQAAKDPATLWSRVGSLLGFRGDGPLNGDALHVQ